MIFRWPIPDPVAAPTLMVGIGGSTPEEVDRKGHWITWFDWLRSGPAPDPDPLADATEIMAYFGDSKVHLRKEETRWLMYLDTRGKLTRRRDFASPFREHAQRTAELWYGTPKDGWHRIDRLKNRSGAETT